MLTSGKRGRSGEHVQMARRPTSSPRHPDRAATEAALEEAALRSLERDGVLAGLNLREVAAEAGVNRGLVYRYFGSPRELLRAALRSDARRRSSEVVESAGLPLREGTLSVLRRDVDDGYLDDLDLGAVHTAMVSLAYGYVLYREHFAAELSVTVGQLDERFAPICDRMLSGLEPH